MRIPFLDIASITQSFEPQLSEAAASVIASGWYLNGERLKDFEERFARYTGMRKCVGVGNGLDALTLALTALKQLEGWQDGDEVVVPALTFVATAEAVVRAGLRPVFCDIDDNFLLSPDEAERAITPRTRALLPVHLYGRKADMPALQDIARRHGLKIVEDAAQAHGNPDVPGTDDSLCRATAYSFYPGKNLGALGDGGAVVTNDEQLAARVRMLANYGAVEKYRHELHGMNSRLDEIQAAILGVKLGRLDEDNRRRQHIAGIYSAGIRNSHVRIPYGGEVKKSVFHIYPVLTPCREALQAHLRREGIDTLIHYPTPLHRLKAFADSSVSFPQAEKVAASELSLPISPLMTDEQAFYVIEKLNSFVP